MSKDTYTFFSRSYVTETRHWEDGSPIHREVHFVIAETPDGRRWSHSGSFKTEAEAEVVAKRFQGLASVWVGPEKDSSWASMQPCYGSKAYAQAWMEYDAATEYWERQMEVGPDEALRSMRADGFFI